MDKVWSRPELIVLVREKPEEAVLLFCKGNPPGPNSSFGSCSLGTGTRCGACEGISQS
jgi:hypothetical protein